MKQLARKWGAAAVLSLLAAPALTLTAAVRSDFDTRAAFSDYRTFAWREAGGDGSDGQQRSLVDSRIRANATAELAKRGLREDSSSPDVILSYRVESGTERTTTVMPSPWGLYGGGGGIWPRPVYRPMYRPYRPMMMRPRGFGYGFGPGFGYGNGYGYGMGPRVIESEYAAGRILLDMVDARTNQVVWQAEVTKTGNSLMDVQSEKSIGKAMKDAFKKFPRKAS